MSDPNAPQPQPDPNAQPQYGQPDPNAQPQYGQPDPNAQPQYAQPDPNAQPHAGHFGAGVPADTTPEPSGISGMFKDPSTLAATGLIAAVAIAIVAGVFNFLGSPPFGGGFKDRLLALTATVDVGDVALLGVAVALLLLTPDPPGGISRELLLRVASLLAGAIAAYGLLRAGVVVFIDQTFLYRIAGFIATLGVAFAAATVSFYAAKESFLHEEGKI